MLLIAEAFRPHFSAQKWNDARSVLAAIGPQTPAARTTVVVRQQALALPDGTEVPVFFKTYEFPRASLAFLWRPSKARCEFLNYGVFDRLGLRCAEAIACGEQRDGLGRLQRAFIITRAIANAQSLIEFAQPHRLNRAAGETRVRRRSVLEQVAGMTRRIHAAGFHHHDLVWRNILVTLEADGAPQVWWIDCPRGGFDRWSPWRQRKRLKDLASLDKLASQHCTRTERLRFLCAYLQRPASDEAVRNLARKVIAYRRQRWPEDWHGK